MLTLRFDGRKRTREELARLTPTQGKLTIASADGHTIARLDCVNSFGLAIAPIVLYECAITRMDARGVILVGQEKVPQQWSQERQPQAWWCRLP